MTDIITEIDDPVSLLEPVAYRIVQTDEALCRAVYGSNRPNPSGISQSGEFPFQTRPAAPPFPCGYHPAWGTHAVSNCSTLWVAVVSSIRSTAANSRTRRSSAAW